MAAGGIHGTVLMVVDGMATTGTGIIGMEMVIMAITITTMAEEDLCTAILITIIITAAEVILLTTMVEEITALGITQGTMLERKAIVILEPIIIMILLGILSLPPEIIRVILEHRIIPSETITIHRGLKVVPQEIITIQEIKTAPQHITPGLLIAEDLVGEEEVQVEEEDNY